MKVIAHRGASGEYPENTLMACRQAIVQQTDAIEIDVFAVENQLVVIHDHHLERTTNGQGNLYQHTLESLQQLDSGLGEHIPTLWQVLQLVQHQCKLNIELKGHNTVAPLLHTLEKAEQQLRFNTQDLLISSFNHHLLYDIYQHRPDLKLGALTASIPLDYAHFATELNAYSVHCAVDFVNAAMVQNAKQRGLKVFVYTVDKPDDIHTMLQLGVDGIFTNYPARSRQIISDLSQKIKPA